MTTDHEALATLNIDIAHAETRGDKPFFENLLAPAFAFRRANGTVVDRQHFVDAVGPSAIRSTAIRSVTFAGTARALVSCVVTMDVQGTPRSFDNMRLFIRADQGDWKLLAWANEAL